MTVYMGLSASGNDSHATFTAASLMSARETIAPRDASSLAVARPMPDAAPVMATCQASVINSEESILIEGNTRTTLPWKDNMFIY